MKTHRARHAILIVLLAALGDLACQGPPQPPPALATAATHYFCPMHPSYVTDAPGDCPICNMRLVPTDGAATPTPTPATTPRILFYRSPMNPAITAKVPTKDEMGMDFVAVYADEAASPISDIPGLAVIASDSNRLRLAGMRSEAARHGTLTRSVRTVGTVVADETRLHHIHSRTGGWVERLFVRYTGEFVRRGDPILSFYSPEVLASEEEYIRIHTAAAVLAKSEFAEARRAAQEMVAAARRRLLLFEVPAAHIDELPALGKASPSVRLFAPISGNVTIKSTFAGQHIEPGQNLFTITDLSRVWIEADAYELDAATLRLGQEATLTLPFDPTFEVVARLSFIDPVVNPDSRTLRLRYEVANPESRLRPNQYVNVDLRLESEAGVLVPDSAVLDSGPRQIVFVETAPQQLEPREVVVGVRSDGTTLIRSGVAEGELVVVEANFLVDAESRLRSAIGAAKSAAAATEVAP